MSNFIIRKISRGSFVIPLVLFLLPAALPAQFLFQDATGSAGINTQYSGIYDGGPGVVVFDLDGDGWDDIFTPGGEDSNRLYLNMRDGTFRDITPSNMKSTTQDSVGGFRVYTRGGIAFDYDNDGFTDIYATCEGRDILWHNNGNGTFTDVTRYPARLNIPYSDNNSMSATFGDFDGDGYNDFYVARWVAESCFTVNDSTHEQDGYCHKGFPNYFYVNNHDGSFTDKAKSYGIDGDTGTTNIAIFFDYDRDGDLDLLIGNDFGVQEMPNRVWKNMLMETGKATFEEVTDQTGLGCHMFNMSIAPCDYNRDGNFDFFESTFGPDSLMRNNGDGTFTSVQKTVLPKGDGYERGDTLMKVSWSAISGDFDNDGWDDEFIVNGYENVFPKWQTDTWTLRDTSMFYRNINGVFTDYTDMAMNGKYIDIKARGGAYLDYNHDGKLDLCIGAIPIRVDPSSNFRLIENITPAHSEAPAHWLEMRFTAKRTAKEAIGTIVDVWTGGIVHSRQVSTGGGFGSQNSLMQHVGLGQYSYADSIIVYWPCDQNRHRQIDRYYSMNGDPNSRLRADTILQFVEQMTKGVAEETPQDNQIKVYPSPARDVLNVTDLRSSITKHFEIYDLLGRKQMDFSGSENTYAISVNELKPGCYMLRITTNGVTETRQFIKD